MPAKPLGQFPGESRRSITLTCNSFAFFLEFSPSPPRPAAQDLGSLEGLPNLSKCLKSCVQLREPVPQRGLRLCRPAAPRCRLGRLGPLQPCPPSVP